MSVQIERGLHDLERFAEAVRRDPDLAERIRQEQARVHAFLEKEGLLEVANPRRDIRCTQSAESEARYNAYQNHLAAVAEEALRTEGDQFVHKSRASVGRAVRARAREDRRIIASYADSTLAHHVFDSGKELTLGPIFRITREGYSLRDPRINQSLTSLVASGALKKNFPYLGWVKTLTRAAEVLPSGATPVEFGFFLTRYDHVSKTASVSERFYEATRFLRRA